jgi:ribonuclease PH
MTASHRFDGRQPQELRPVQITPHYLPQAEGSALITLGRTWVVCTASVEARVPPFLQNTGQGWITAEYDMLPRATHTRRPRAAVVGRLSGRTQEIQRLIGRSLRAVIDLNALGERTILMDCDVLQADGGTRTAAITGAFVALVEALALLQRREELDTMPVLDQVVAVSVGRVHERLLVDLDYQEDSRAEVDANFVVTGRGELVEVQATGERGSFPVEMIAAMFNQAQGALARLRQAQEEALRPWLPLPW